VVSPFARLELRARLGFGTDDNVFRTPDQNYVDVKRTERVDQYVGYNDYSRDSFSFELHWQPTERLDFEASGIYQLYDYPNAFAFHVPAAGRKTQEAADAKFVATYRLTEHLSLAAEAVYRETVSNDTRIQYERRQYLLGVRWER